MKHTYHIRMRVAFRAVLGLAAICSLAAEADPTGTCVHLRTYCPGKGWVTSSCNATNPCGSSPGGGGYQAPSYDYEAARRAQEAAAAAERQRQAEADRIERERLAEEKRKKDAEFIRNRDATANTLKGSSGGAMSQLRGLAGTDNSGLRGSGFDTGSQLKSAPAPMVDNRNEPAGPGGKSKSKGTHATPKPAPSGDPMVVDARNVPSGLPKALDNAIATAYSTAPPGVSDRVRKGFQAVMVRDWKVAKAWFQDALNRDPNNAGLKRLVALTDSSQQPNPPPATVVDNRNEPAGLGGRSDAREAGAPPNKTKPASASATDPSLVLPDPNDMRFIFPGLQAMKDREAPVYKTLPDGRRVQLPQDSDMVFLFGPPSQPPASKSGKTK